MGILFRKAKFMKRSRHTYPDAFHHGMSRDIRGEYIFPDDGDKKIFLEILSEKAKLPNVRLIGYCVMSNHYHVLLENSRGNRKYFLTSRYTAKNLSLV